MTDQTDGDDEDAPDGGEETPAQDPDVAASGITDEVGPNVQAMGFWDEVIADMEATAAEYEEAGWETLQLHPGDATVVTGEHGDRVGLDVLVADNEYAELEELLEDGATFEGYRVYKAASGGMTFLVVAMEDPASETAVLFPAYYSIGHPDTETLFEKARESGELHSYLRRLDGEYVEFSHDEPGLFAPPEGEEIGE